MMDLADVCLHWLRCGQLVRRLCTGLAAAVVHGILASSPLLADEPLPQAGAVPAAAPASAAAPPLADRAQAILRTRCVVCHGAEQQEGGLRLDSLTAAQTGGNSGPAIVAGNAADSLLLRAVSFDDSDLQMPPRQKLSEREIQDLTEWIRQGAAWSVQQSGTPSESAQGDAWSDPENPIRRLFAGERLDLWSLRRPQADLSGLPPLAAAASQRADREAAARRAAEMIDRLVQAGWQQAQLEPAEEADRRTLIRRLTYDLTGLPPTPEEVDSFLADTAADAWPRLVERLLNSPHYGERQATLWLDVVRYADTNGYERDEFRPLAWKYRDYVIRAFNQDKGFDQFILEQLAGDELISVARQNALQAADGSADPADAGLAVLTAVNTTEAGLPAPRTAAEVDMLLATGYLRLGQWDSTASIFQEEDRLRAEQLADLTNTTASAFLGLTMSCCQCHDHKYDPLSQADHYRLRAFFAAVRPRDDLPAAVPDQQSAAAAESDSPLAMAATDSGSEAPATHILYQGDHAAPQEEVQPGFPSVLAPGPASVQSPRSDTTGRRLALARWIASADNPWTARVLVNRIWQQHFGTGIVATANDFGYSGARPTHPELLDWLAMAFVQQGWSVKELHRWIVLSDTYRRSSQAAPHSADPRNQLLARQNARRLDAESLRDALLAVAGLLQPVHGGRPRWPAVPDELTHAQPAILEALKNDDGGRMQGWYTDPEDQTDVRSIFLIRKRCLPLPFLQVFDLPDTSVSCARRDTTVVAPQALMLLNSPEGIRCATALARRVAGDAPRLQLEDSAPAEQLIERVFRLVLLRAPDAIEGQLAISLLRQHAAIHRAAGAMSDLPAVTDLCRALLNTNEFAYLD